MIFASKIKQYAFYSCSGSGQIMAYINDPAGIDCGYGTPCAQCCGIRLPYDCKGGVPPHMLMIDVPEDEYIIFEHGPFDYEQENCNKAKKTDILT